MNPAYDTLRIALTHEEGKSGALLPFEQIRLVAKAAVGCGVRRFELCGGEPLLREDIPVLVMMLSSLTVLEDMTLVTDGILLPRWAKALRGAGISRVIVTLDTFDPAAYRALTGGDITAVLTGIRSLAEVGFPPATIQARLIRGISGSSLPSLLRLAKMTGISLRLMEMTQAEADALAPDARMTCADALALILKLSAQEGNPFLYRLPGAAGQVELIPCCQREEGRIVLSAGGMLRAGSFSADVRHLNEQALMQIMQESIR